MGDGNKVVVEAIGTFILHLKTSFYLDLFETFFASSFRRNLISISSLDKSGFSSLFGTLQKKMSNWDPIIKHGRILECQILIKGTDIHCRTL